MALLGRARNSVQRLRKRFLLADASASPYSYAMLSHPGRVRKGNEDACAVSLEAGGFVVCDGMGGAAAGEIASQLAVDTFLEHLRPPRRAAGDTGAIRRATPDVRLDEAIHAANHAVFDYALAHPAMHGMGTTLVALLVELPAADEAALRPSLTLAHVGDSRCYLFRGSTLRLLTQDHSLVEEQLRSGQITAAEAERHPMRNIITRAVGSQPMVEPELTHLDPRPGDLFLLASDGLTRELSDAALTTILNRARYLQGLRQRTRGQFLDLASICQTLVDEANDRGGGDNITVLLLQMA